MNGPSRARKKLRDDERTWMLILPTTPRGKAFDRFVLRWTGFSFMTYQFAKARRVPYHREHLLLTTIGSKTGRLRTSALPYFRYEDKLVVCGSKSGGPKDPFWSNNIRANPQCWIRVKGRQVPAWARVAEGEERDKVFSEVALQHPNLEPYEQLAGTHGRHVPLVLLDPREPLPRGA
jgi:deazaflavin-dependent oxidoreductase (nitroreductase family)